MCKAESIVRPAAREFPTFSILHPARIKTAIRSNRDFVRCGALGWWARPELGSLRLHPNIHDHPEERFLRHPRSSA